MTTNIITLFTTYENIRFKLLCNQKEHDDGKYTYSWILETCNQTNASDDQLLALGFSKNDSSTFIKFLDVVNNQADKDITFDLMMKDYHGKNELNTYLAMPEALQTIVKDEMIVHSNDISARYNDDKSTRIIFVKELCFYENAPIVDDAYKIGNAEVGSNFGINTRNIVSANTKIEQSQSMTNPIYERYLNILKTYSVTDKEEIFFTPPINDEDIQKFEDYFGFDKLNPLSQDIRDFIFLCTGENEIWGLVAGNELLSIDQMINNHKLSLTVDYNLESYHTGFIKNGQFNKNWIPFADGGDGSYFCFDFAPDIKGTKGQIIAIDLDTNTSYLIARNLPEFLNWLEKQHKELNIIFNWQDDEKYFSWKSGSIFNNDGVAVLMGIEESADEVAIDDFWREAIEKRYSPKITNGMVKTSDLLKVKLLFLDIKDNVDFSIIKYMENLSELNLLLHISVQLPDLSKHEKLKRVSLNYNFDESHLKWASELSQIKILWFGNNETLKDISIFEKSKNIKELRLYTLPHFDGKGLDKLSFITNLSIDKIPNLKLEYLHTLKNLKELVLSEYDDYSPANLDFLSFMPKLTRFKSNRAKDESNIEALKTLKAMKELEYPLPNVSFALDMLKISIIGLDTKTVNDYEKLAELPNIISVELFNVTDNDNEQDKYYEIIKKYCKKLQSCGYK